jgi:magnesium and cobalt transporter
MSQERGKDSWFERLSHLLIREPKDRGQLIDVLRDAEERNILSAEILSMIESVIQLSEMHVRDVMIPKTQMVVFHSEDPLDTLLPAVIESAHSRYPIVDSTNDDIIGILLAKDLLRYHSDPSLFKVTDIMRAPAFVPQSKRLDILLREFRINRNHMAIVLDEYGHVAGLITIEDVLEQIVGDIEDEYDIDEVDEIKKHDGGVYTVKASTPIEDFNTSLHTNFKDDEFDTIGGLVLKGFGHLPKRGETIKIKNYRFKILHSDNRRIYLLEVTKT